MYLILRLSRNSLSLDSDMMASFSLASSTFVMVFWLFLGDYAAMACFAHGLSLNLVQAPLDFQGGRSFSVIRLLFVGELQQVLHELKLFGKLLANCGIRKPIPSAFSLHLG